MRNAVIVSGTRITSPKNNDWRKRGRMDKGKKDRWIRQNRDRWMRGVKSLDRRKVEN